MRFSIRRLLGLVAAAAIACAGMANATDLVESCFHAAAVLILLAATILATLRPGDGRAFWVGFAIAGWGIYMTQTPLLDTGNSQLSDQMLSSIGTQIGYQDDALFYSIEGDLINGSESEALAMPLRNFVGVGNSVLSLIIGLLGGCFGAYVNDRGRPVNQRTIASG